MKKVVIAIVVLTILTGLCYGTVWYFNKDKKIEGPDDTLTDTINDRFTPFQDMSTSTIWVDDISCIHILDIEGYDPDKDYPSKIHIKDGKVYFDYIVDLKSTEAKGITGTAKKLIYVGYAGEGTHYYAVLTEEGDAYINYLCMDCCSNIEEFVTFTKVKTPSKVLDITSRADFHWQSYNEGDLYVYLEPKELRFVEFSYGFGDSPSATTGKRWGELYPYMDSFGILDSISSISIRDDKSISLHTYISTIIGGELIEGVEHNINLTYNKKNIEVKYIYEKYYSESEEDLDNIVYILDTQNNLYKLDGDKIDFKQDSHELVLIDKYDKIEVKELENNDSMYIVLFTKGEDTETINIDLPYEFHIRTDYDNNYDNVSE